MSKNKMNKLCLILAATFFVAGCLPEQIDKSVLQFKEAPKRAVASSDEAMVADLEQGGLVIRMSDRYYVSSLLLDVFGTNANTAVVNYVKVKMDAFGGGCDQYDKTVNASNACLNDDCNNVQCNGTNVIDKQIGMSSVIRQGWLIRACEDITNVDNAVLYTIRNVVENQTYVKATVPAPTVEGLIKAYGLFYRTGTPNEAVITALAKVSDTETTSNFDKWRYVLLSLCVTPEWQIP